MVFVHKKSIDGFVMVENAHPVQRQEAKTGSTDTPMEVASAQDPAPNTNKVDLEVAIKPDTTENLDAATSIKATEQIIGAIEAETDKAFDAPKKYAGVVPKKLLSSRRSPEELEACKERVFAKFAALEKCLRPTETVEPKMVSGHGIMENLVANKELSADQKHGVVQNIKMVEHILREEPVQRLKATKNVEPRRASVIDMVIKDTFRQLDTTKEPHVAAYICNEASAKLKSIAAPPAAFDAVKHYALRNCVMVNSTADHADAAMPPTDPKPDQSVLPDSYFDSIFESQEAVAADLKSLTERNEALEASHARRGGRMKKMQKHLTQTEDKLIEAYELVEACIMIDFEDRKNYEKKLKAAADELETFKREAADRVAASQTKFNEFVMRTEAYILEYGRFKATSAKELFQKELCKKQICQGPRGVVHDCRKNMAEVVKQYHTAYRTARAAVCKHSNELYKYIGVTPVESRQGA